MYKYFKELENPSDFNIYLKEVNSTKENYYYYVQNIPFNSINISKILNKNLEFIKMLTTGMNIKFPKTYMTYEEYISFYDFFTYRNEEADYYIDNYSLNLNIIDFKNMLKTYSVLSNYLIEFFPEYKERITKIKQDVLKIAKEIDEKSTIVIEKPNNSKHTFPNAWFITPNGYLYNTGGKNGHKEGNLIYPFYHIIKQALYNNKIVPEYNNLQQIKCILKRGYVTQSDFNYYANLIDKLPTIKTPEVELEEEKYKKLLEMSEEEFLKIDYDDLPHPERSYQRNIITLVTGHLSAEESLYKSFTKFNSSNKKINHIKKIEELTNLYMPDILVRYSGFHKIESQLDKVITTSSINKIDGFKSYLDKGWTLQLIPGIIYDEKEDKIVEMNFNSYYIDKYLEKKQKEYTGKILIK